MGIISFINSPYFSFGTVITVGLFIWIYICDENCCVLRFLMLASHEGEPGYMVLESIVPSMWECFQNHHENLWIWPQNSYENLEFALKTNYLFECLKTHMKILDLPPKLNCLFESTSLKLISKFLICH